MALRSRAIAAAPDRVPWRATTSAAVRGVPGQSGRGVPAVGCFWASYALTRPLGASIADYLAAKPSGGGLGWGTGPVTAVGLVLFAGLVAYVTLTHSDVEGTHHAAVGSPDREATPTG